MICSLLYVKYFYSLLLCCRLNKKFDISEIKGLEKFTFMIEAISETGLFKNLDVLILSRNINLEELAF